MMTTGEVSKLTGIGKKSLQRYNDWGLISPKRSEAGYMLFTEDDLVKLFLVKLCKDLGYKVKDIKAAFDRPDFDVRESLDCRITELEVQLRKDKEQLLFAKEMRKLIENEDGPNTGEAICALLRHPEYAWVLTDEDSEEGEELAAYFKWAARANKRITEASPSELDECLNQLIEESEGFGTSTRFMTQMLISLFDLEERGVPANSEEVRAVVADAYYGMGDNVEGDLYISFYMLGKYYKVGGMTPPSFMAQLDEKSMEQLADAESFIGEAIGNFVDTLELTEERARSRAN